jgi:hypothetical protein
MTDTAFSPAVSVYSSLLASWKFAVAAGQTKVADAIHDVMDLAWLELSVEERNRWFQGER